MSGRFFVPPGAIDAQRKASDPKLSAWVAANAGSGKTYVLARRVVRLMLAGTPPGAILCLTFTKAAAATMANRVFAVLGEWALLDDRALADRLEEIEGLRPTAAQTLRARRLFAEALETPGGLKVQTIHAFCERVLHQFPFEANVASRFTVLDERASAEMVERAKLAVLGEAAADPEGRLGRALAVIAAAAADQTVADLLSDVVEARDTLRRQIGAEADLDRAHRDLGALFGLGADETEEAIAARILGEALILPSECAAVAAAIEALSGSSRDLQAAERLRQAAAGTAESSAAYLAVFLTAEGAPRKDVVTKAVREADQALGLRLEAEKARLAALVERRKAAALRDRTMALLTLGHAVLARVEAEKAVRGALDFDDLVAKTRDLFARVEARWILYKLDQGIDHILVDEAQDTSPAQWSLVEALAGEFTAGRGAREAQRTLFVVGDEKQSIYSFQGADPQWFDAMRRLFAQRFREANQPFERIELTFSFRSAPAVLSAVDKVFEGEDARRGLTADGSPIRPHEAARRDAAGLVELWPAVEPEEAAEHLPWRAPLDAREVSDPVVRLAGRIARHIRLWLDRGERLPDKDRPIRAGDILILVRRRGPLFDAVIRALKNASVPVAGADRLVLTEHIAVMDLMALADAMLTPEDDLTLATVLRSPLIGLGEQELERLAAYRSGSLWEAVQASGLGCASQLEAWRALAKSLSPADFFGRILSRDLGGGESGRACFLRRLGLEAADAIDEFLSLALGFETAEVPTLRGFLSFMRAARTEVKRDMDLGRDEVRVMTVHGSKGLEADIVFLADTTSKPGGRHDPKLFAVGREERAPHLVWSPSSKADVGAVADRRQELRMLQEEEYRRLLYVAMTRAADKLIVCGAKSARNAADVWYDMVTSVLGPMTAEEPADDGEGTVSRWWSGTIASAPMPAAMAPPEPVALPDWLKRPAPRPAAAPRPLSPARLGFEDDGAPAATGTLGREAALQRGVVVHRLLQSLPQVAPEGRAKAMDDFLARQAGLAEDERAAIRDKVAALLETPRFQVLFDAAGLAEVPVVGKVAGRPVSGQIDRLAMAGGRLVIIDYKTNDPAPRTIAEVPEPYILQLALYRALLAEIHPDKVIEALLVWTSVPDIMPVSEAAMAAALARAGLAP